MRQKIGRCLRVALALLSLSGGVTLVGQSRPSADPAAVSGVVTNSATGAPILRAHVTLQRGAMTPAVASGPGMQIIDGDADAEMKTYGALTNAEGKFTIASLPPGQYFVSAERIGFVLPVNLRSNSNSVALAAGDTKDLKLKLTPAGVITGRILDAAGKPVPNAEVRTEGPGGDHQVGADEEGRYRIGGLYPGKYRIRAAPQQQFFGSEIRTDGSREVHYAATYYPDSTTRGFSRALDVEPAAALSGIDIRLVSNPIVRVSGKVTDLPAGQTRADIQAVREGQGNFGGGPQNSVKADGSFMISTLDPGKYTLFAIIYGPGQHFRQSAPLEIEVAGANIEHLELRMIAPFEVAGQVHFDDETMRMPKTSSTPGPDNAPKFTPPRRLRLLPVNGQMGSGEMQADIGADDSFTLEKVAPGRYRIALSWGQGYIRAVRAGATETEGNILDVSSGTPGAVTVWVSPLTCEVSGMVNDASGPVVDAQVIAIPESDNGGYVRAASTKADGTYNFTGMPPGKYKLAVIEGGTYLNMTEPRDALEDYEDVAESIDLRLGDKLTKDLKRE